MAESPGGIITFLLTDVEGSTALWEEAPESMRVALGRHDVLFEHAINDHHGLHIRPRGEGDSRFAVFSSALDAVAAASAIQRTFAVEPWVTLRPIRVRIGVHTGEAQLRDGNYYGSSVNRCARIRTLGHGGQTLISEATATLIQDDLPSGITLLDLGIHRLKDLTRPERVFQVTASDLGLTFPSLASVDAYPNNLPIQTTSLIGRGREVATIRNMLLGDDVRLVTLTGPGGAGKTRLALHVAAEVIEQFPDGVYFVDLSPVTDPSLLASTIATVLGAVGGSEHPLAALQRFLARRSLLLVLDNFEQIVSAGSVVTDLLTASAGLRVLVTSRAALQVRGEHEVETPPLEVPDPDRSTSFAMLQHNPSITLFVERAQAISPEFELTAANVFDVAAICARLDGLPLALELAAARSRLLAPAAMVRRLERRLPLLNSGPRDLPTRQQALRDTITWSYELLGAAERQVFRRLAVFVGGFALDAAEVVVSDDGQSLKVFDAVEQLVVQSLVRVDRESGPEPRFRMLETIREYASEQLEASGEVTRLRDRHLRWCADMLEGVARGIKGPEQAAGLDRVEDEHDNARAALAWADRTGDVTGSGLQIARHLGSYFWSPRGYHREGRAWFERLLAHVPPRSVARAAGLRVAGNLAVRQNDYAAAGTALTEAIEILRQIGDHAGVAATLRSLGVVPHHLGDLDSAQAMFEESISIARRLGDAETLGIALRNLADLLQDRVDIPRAVTAYEESLALARTLQIPHDVAYNLRGLGNLARAQGQYARADALLRESLTLLKPLHDRRCIPLSLEGLACITVGDGWADRAARILGAASVMQARTGAPSPPSGAADYRRTVADARDLLGAERFDLAWAEGAAMSLDEAVDLALAEQRQVARSSEATAVGRSSDGHPQPSVPLSLREREVVGLISSGLSNREIAERLVLSVRTVERHIENVYNRLGISGKAGRAIVTAYALRYGLVVSS